MLKHIIAILLICGSVFFIGKPQMKYYLLLCGLTFIPFSYDYEFFQYNDVENFQGWVSAIMIRLSDVFFCSFCFVVPKKL